MENKNSGCLKIVIWFGGFALLGLVWELVTTFILGSEESIRRFLNTDEDNISTLRFLFWSVLIAVILYFVLGGKAKDIFKGDKE